MGSRGGWSSEGQQGVVARGRTIVRFTSVCKPQSISSSASPLAAQARTHRKVLSTVLAIQPPDLVLVVTAPASAPPPPSSRAELTSCRKRSQYVGRRGTGRTCLHARAWWLAGSSRREEEGLTQRNHLPSSAWLSSRLLSLSHCGVRLERSEREKDLGERRERASRAGRRRELRWGDFDLGERELVPSWLCSRLLRRLDERNDCYSSCQPSGNRTRPR